VGNTHLARLLSTPVQTKLTVGAPNDTYEQEADRVADTVMRMAEPQVAPTAPVSRRAGSVRLQRLCPECEQQPRQLVADTAQDETLQLQEEPGRTPEVPPTMESSLHTAKGGGQPLADSVRAAFEPRFDADFSGVKVHTDAQADTLNRSLNARAFTTGQDIFLRQGEYNPSSRAGQALLAHELTHVVQQEGAQRQGARTQAKEGAVAGGAPTERDKGPVNFLSATGPVSQVALMRDAHGETIRRTNGGGAKATPSWTADELKKMLKTCDGGLDIWAKAKKANKDNDPLITPGAGGATDPATGNITLDQTRDKCFAVQQLIQELSNLSRMADFNKIFDSAAAGDCSREDFIKRIEKIEYETGVKNVLTAFDACKDKWPCTTTPKEWARTAKDFDDYFKNFLSNVHKEHYGTFWDSNYKAAYDKKHVRK
jgi:hypothetical protein